MHDGTTIESGPRMRTTTGLPTRSLRVRFVLAISALVAVVLVALVGVLAFTSRQELRRDIERRAVSHAELAVRPICEAFETYYASGYTKFRELVTDVIELNPDLASVRLYRTTGELLFDGGELDSRGLSSTPTVEAVAPPSPRTLAAVKGLEVEMWVEEREVERLFIVAVPYIEEWGRHRYSVVFEISYDGLHTATQAVAARLLWLSAGSLLLGVFIAIFLARQSLGPVEQLTAGARDLGEGHLDRRLRIGTGDEFEVLARTFNHMASRLSSTIADLETSNRALQQSNVELKELDRFKSDLLANVSHELRTPLTSLRGYNEAMSERLLGPLTGEQTEALQVSARNIQRLLGMIDELLGFARFESREIHLDRQPTDLRVVTEQVVGSVRAARGPDLDLLFEIEDDLPMVDCDADRIGQVIENLVTNAVKFTPAGGRIELMISRSEQGARIEVRDSGIGIEAEEASRIFDRFYQVESSTTRKYGGIGLGLAIVRQILDAHGVAIEVESVVGEGAVFRFELPLAGRSEVSTAAARVLVVDEDREIRHALRDRFLAEGWSARAVATYDAAAGLLATFAPHVVVLDRLLPDGDGFDLIEGGPEAASVPPMFVVVSSRPDEPLARRLGATKHFLKPVEPELVVTAVASLLASEAAAEERTA